MKIKLCVKRSRTATSNPHQASSSLSANVVANNDDLLVEILYRLPIKSLLIFKCVSKHWLLLISDPHFSRRRFPTPYPVSGLFLRTSSCVIGQEFKFLPLDSEGNLTASNPLTYLTFGKNRNLSGITILQSCNGLLLCRRYNGFDHYSECYVYNPTTKQLSKLPRLLRLRDGNGCRGSIYLTLAFDLSKSPHYKVICVQIFVSMDQYQIQIQIYSPGTGRRWRICRNLDFTASDDASFYNGVYWNGAIHWIGPSLCFHIDEEQVKKMPFPPAPRGINNEETRRVRYFGESCDHLHLIESYSPHFRQLHIYEMERDYSRWSVKYCVDLDHIIAAFPEMIRSYLDPFDFHHYALAIFCFVRREENGHGSFLVLHVPRKVVHYNLHSKSFKTICDFPPSYMDPDNVGRYLEGQWWDVFQFIESIYYCV